VCSDIIGLLDKFLIPSALDPEAKVRRRLDSVTLRRKLLQWCGRDQHLGR
jgi:hypothetical protein